MTSECVAVAGTFGPLHDGHRNLLRTALQYGDGGLVVGVTTDEFAQSSRTRDVPAYETRVAAVEAAIAAEDAWGREYEIRRIENEHDVVDEVPDVDALVVSPETAPEIAAINEGRRQRGFDPLVGIVAPYVLAADGDRISSTRIANGEIDEHGALLADG
jgi:pantetheine-phosphate adenylyltransferase